MTARVDLARLGHGPPKISGVRFLHFFRFWPLKCFFCLFTVIFYPLLILAVNWQKMQFNGQNRKKWRKRTPLIFWFYMKLCPPTFSGGPLGWENDIFSKNRTCLIWRHIFPESLMPHGQFAILVTSGPLFKTVLHFYVDPCEISFSHSTDSTVDTKQDSALCRNFESKQCLYNSWW